MSKQCAAVKFAKRVDESNTYPRADMLSLCYLLVKAFTTKLRWRPEFDFLQERLRISENQFSETHTANTSVVHWKAGWEVNHSEAMALFKDIPHQSFAVHLSCKVNLTFIYEHAFVCLGSVEFKFSGIGDVKRVGDVVVTPMLVAPPAQGTYAFDFTWDAPPAAEPALTEWIDNTSNDLVYAFAQCLLNSHPLWLNLLSLTFGFSWGRVESRFREKWEVRARELVVSAMSKTKAVSTGRLPEPFFSLRTQPPTDAQYRTTLFGGGGVRFRFFVPGKERVTAEVTVNILIEIEPILLHPAGHLTVTVRGHRLGCFVNGTHQVINEQLQGVWRRVTVTPVNTIGVRTDVEQIIANIVFDIFCQLITVGLLVQLIKYAGRVAA